jgi:hypothetical protein
MSAVTKTPSKSKAKARSKPKHKPAIAFHGADGDNHITGIFNLRVVLVPDGKFWFAQGLEIDYSSQGSSPEDAKAKFEAGLTETIQQHLQIHNSIEKMLKVAPTEVWDDLVFHADAKLNRYSQVCLHNTATEVLGLLPFQGIDYLQRAA